MPETPRGGEVDPWTEFLPSRVGSQIFTLSIHKNGFSIMPKPRKSADVLRLKGTWRNDRHGPIPPPEGEPLGKPPASLPAEFRAAWADIVTAGDGRLVHSDAVLAEVAARCLTAIRGPDARGQDSANLLRAMAALQIDPAHRRAIQRPDAFNEFDIF